MRVCFLEFKYEGFISVSWSSSMRVLVSVSWSPSMRVLYLFPGVQV